MTKRKGCFQSIRRRVHHQRVQVTYDECKNCRRSVVTGSGGLDMQAAVDSDVIRHRRKGIFSRLGDISYMESIY